MKIVILILVCYSNLIYGQNSNLKSETISHQLVSAENKEYEIIVTLPPNYDKSKTYPTLYYLDAWWLEDIVKGNNTLLYRSRITQKIILVGISTKGNELQFNEQRTLDYTPNPFDQDLMKFPLTIPIEPKALPIDSTNSGKSIEFRRFLKDKVFAFISENYPAHKYDKGIIGHSFGGLFAVHDAFSKAPLFQKHIIISPALWWNKSQQIYLNLDNNFKNSSNSANLFICYGEFESSSIKKFTDILLENFEEINSDRLKYHFEFYKNEDHVSILPKSIYSGINYFYKKE